MHPNKALFSEGLLLILQTWSALQLALSLSSTHYNLDDLHFSLMDYFSVHGQRIEVEDLEDILVEVMGREFGVGLEDGSEVQVGRMIWELYRQSIRGETRLLDALKAKKNQLRENPSHVGQTMEQETSEEEEEIE